MQGKCRECGKKAHAEFLIRGKGAAWTLKYCKKHLPVETPHVTKIS
jgi:hypothetical protein